MNANKYIDFKLIHAVTGNVYQPSVEYAQLIKEINSLKEENRLWTHAYYEIIKLFGEIIPINDELVHNSIDKQNTLLSICRDMIKAINDPESLFQKYQKQPQKESPVKKNAKPKKENNPDSFLKNKPKVEQLQSSLLTNRLHDIDKKLTKEIKKNKRYIPKSSHKKKLSPSPHKKEKIPLSPYPGQKSPLFHGKSKRSETPKKSDLKNTKKNDEIEIEKQNLRAKSPPAKRKKTESNRND